MLLILNEIGSSVKIYILEDPDPDYLFLPEIYLSQYEWEWATVSKETAVPTVYELAKREFGVVLNLCDGSRYEPTIPGVEVIEALEALNLPFTGADSSFYEPTREEMKRVCREQGIGTPAGVFLWDHADLRQAVAGLRYPLLVKHPNSYASIGLLPESRVDDFTGLESQVRRVMEAYGGALVEEFIAGREFSALAVEDPDAPGEPLIYPPVEFLFPPGESFKHESLKWKTFQNMKCIPLADPDLAAAVQEMTRRMFVGMRGSGYGRCDFRMNTAGELFLLEINPNCGVFYPPETPGTADTILSLDPAGHAGFVDLLVRGALKRYERNLQHV
jgi:D-alanine-D-alanine ligase-like ATP-grasp enzyme